MKTKITNLILINLILFLLGYFYFIVLKRNEIKQSNSEIYRIAHKISKDKYYLELHPKKLITADIDSNELMNVAQKITFHCHFATSTIKIKSPVSTNTKFNKSQISLVATGNYSATQCLLVNLLAQFGLIKIQSITINSTKKGINLRILFHGS